MLRILSTTTIALALMSTGLFAGGPATSSAPAPVAQTAEPAAQSPEASARRIVLGGVRVRLRPGTRQVITSNATSATYSTVALWRKRGGDWDRVQMTRSGRTGYGGLVPGPEREQGTGTTPLGTYRITETFGNAPRPRRTALPFHRVRQGDYWVQDNGSRFYNQRRHKSQGGFRWWLDGANSSEHLPDYGAQYAWSLVIDFNRPRPVKRRGSGIFLHVNGDGATAGCVSAPRPFIRSMMGRLRPGLRPVMAIGR